MEYLLGKVTQQAMNYAIRSGITLTASFAIKQSTILLKNAPRSDVTDEYSQVQRRLEHKIRIVSPAIDLIELIAARGNTSLESAVSLTKELRLGIQELGQRIARAAAASHKYKAVSTGKKTVMKSEDEHEIKQIIADISKLIARIEDAVPLINLALTTSGAKLSTQLPSTISPSRLLQASTFLTAGDTQYAQSPSKVAQIGPTFTLSVYMLFTGHDRPETEEDIRQTTWKEVIHKARIKLRRVPLDIVMSTGSGSSAMQSHEIAAAHTDPKFFPADRQIRGDSRLDEFAYQIVVIEDYDDDRHHDFEAEDAKPTPFDEVEMAGIREMIPVHEISKIFYADTSKVLNIGSDAESNNPVLLLRRDIFAVPPRRMMELDGAVDTQSPDGMASQDQGYKSPRSEQLNSDSQDKPRDPWQFPPSLDPEWIALEVYQEAPETDSDTEDEVDPTENEKKDTGPETPSENDVLSISLSSMNIGSSNTMTLDTPRTGQRAWMPQIKTSLSMLEMLLRLTSLQQFQQQSHLSIPDELLNFFLEESASTGAGGNESHRQAIRADARRRVGFDPYNESPIKHRGEQYGNVDQGGYESPSFMASNSRMQSPHFHNARLSDPPQSMRSSNRHGTPTYETHEASVISGSEPSYLQRPDWLKQKSTTPSRGSPLGRRDRDEGIGTSPSGS